MHQPNVTEAQQRQTEPAWTKENVIMVLAGTKLVRPATIWLVNVDSLLTVTIQLIQFNRKVPCKFWGSDPYFERTSVCRWLEMVYR